jgi:hypothetical protein
VRLREECCRLHLVLHELHGPVSRAFDSKMCDKPELPGYRAAATEAEWAAASGELRDHCCPRCCPLVFTYWEEPTAKDSLSPFQATRRKLRVKVREHQIAMRLRAPPQPTDEKGEQQQRRLVHDDEIVADDRPLDALVQFINGTTIPKKEKKTKQ